MLFTGPEFLLLFLPLALGTFLLARRSGRLSTILAALIAVSLALYSYSEPGFVPVMIVSVGLTYSIGELVRRCNDTQASNWLFAAGVALNLLPFLYFKYVSAIPDTDPVLGAWAGATIPLGISFFTFQQIAYLLDVRRKTVPPVRFGKYCLFILFFPHLVAGPIVRHNELIGQLTLEGLSQNLQAKWAAAVSLFAVGLLKKVVVADNLAGYVDPSLQQVALGAVPGLLEAWTLMMAAAAQIYYDYSAYGDMALALALCFGLHLPISFYSPYKALSVADFWRRWNITLMRFFRDHIYIPLGGNRHGRPRQLLAILVTMVCCGIWHGAGGNFVLWGTLVAVFIGLEIVVKGRWTDAGARTTGNILVARAVVLLAYVGPLAFFLFPSAEQALGTLAGMVGLNGATWPVWMGAAHLNPAVAHPLMPGRVDLALVLGAWAGIYLLPNTYQLFHRQLSSPWTDPSIAFLGLHRPSALAWRPNWTWALLSAALLSLGISTLGADAARAFYYFRF